MPTSYQDRDFGKRAVVKLHIDRLDREDRQVWGVTMDRVGESKEAAYTRATVVDVLPSVGPAVAVFRPGKRQPKAWIEYHNVTVRRVVLGAVVQVTIS